ncbi:DnaJ-domain-containing protein [Trametes versicolor FP-101664 SS1]|uniref:DnaJ-domain-containing protein n=1 Tax=Trametes versicolor (strain FP-101664) TaxID=717944 RepID=UPI00046232AE|nr:DnaJ-domain-containing protein [Trametes versicolor FP-101664 SS1]EIW53748.1 DnaJ-domain-containing protein [Trametes versicolor FP-101664 SS1]
MHTPRPSSLRLPLSLVSHASQHRHSAAAASAARVRVRVSHFSISSPNHGHYRTLDIPKDASRNQIKSSFYKLSKQYHPDVNSDPGAKAKFQAVSEAYAVLGDERKRRAYDRTLTSAAPTHPHESHHAHPYAPWAADGRRRGATHAWEYARRPNAGPRHSYSYSPPPPGAHYSPPPGAHYAHPNANYGHHARDPWAHPNVQRATGRRGPLPTGQGPGPGSHESISVLGRAIMVVGLVFVIATVGHGVSASA